MTRSSQILEAGKDPNDAKAFASDPVLAFYPRDFTHRNTLFPMVLAIAGTLIFLALGVAGIYRAFTSDVFGGEEVLFLVLAAFGLLMVYVLGSRLLDPRTRTAWQEVRGDHKVNLASEWFTVPGGASEAGELHRLFTAEDVEHFPAMVAGRSLTGINVGLHIFGQGAPLYVTIWLPEGRDVRAWPLVRMRRTESGKWAQKRMLPGHGIGA